MRILRFMLKRSVATRQRGLALNYMQCIWREPYLSRIIRATYCKKGTLIRK